MPEAQKPRQLGCLLLRGGIVGLVAAVLWQVGDILFGPNLHTVLPGAVYRCSQPSPEGLERIIRRYGIRTVVNMRGCSDPAQWYRDQCRVTARLNVSQEDLGFSAGRLPPVPMLRHLLDVLERSERPLLIHCHKGADRTGMASALVLLLFTDASVSHARGQLAPRTGHLAIGRTANIDRFFDLYEEWLARQGLEHAPNHLRRWVRHEYSAGEGRAAIEVISHREAPVRVPCQRPFFVRVRCHNTSAKPWHFQPGTNAGIHVKFAVMDDQFEAIKPESRIGMFFATVSPGEHIDLTIPLPPLPRPGRYVLRVDLTDEQHGSFLQLGSEPLFCDLEAT